MRKVFSFVILLFVIANVNAQDLNISQYAFYRDGLNPGSFM